MNDEEEKNKKSAEILRAQKNIIYAQHFVIFLLLLIFLSSGYLIYLFLWGKKNLYDLTFSAGMLLLAFLILFVSHTKIGKRIDEIGHEIDKFLE